MKSVIHNELKKGDKVMWFGWSSSEPHEVPRFATVTEVTRSKARGYVRVYIDAPHDAAGKEQTTGRFSHESRWSLGPDACIYRDPRVLA